jgi:hypothetical protein
MTLLREERQQRASEQAVVGEAQGHPQESSGKTMGWVKAHSMPLKPPSQIDRVRIAEDFTSGLS